MGEVGIILARVIDVVFSIIWWAILIRVLLSWLPMANVRIDPYHPAIRALYAITDPILDPLRKFTTVGMIDLSPLVALLLLDVLRRILISILVS